MKEEKDELTDREEQMEELREREELRESRGRLGMSRGYKERKVCRYIESYRT